MDKPINLSQHKKLLSLDFLRIYRTYCWRGLTVYCF